MTIPDWQKAVGCQRTHSQGSESRIETMPHNWESETDYMEKKKYWDADCDGIGVGNVGVRCLDLTMSILYKQAVSADRFICKAQK